MAEENTTQQVPSPKEKNIGMAIVAYLLFFVPLLTEAKNDPFVKYHVKQGLVLFLSWVVLSVVGWILPWFLAWIRIFLSLGLVVLLIIGIMNAAKGEQKPLPLIGKIGEQFKF